MARTKVSRSKQTEHWGAFWTTPDSIPARHAFLIKPYPRADLRAKKYTSPFAHKNDQEQFLASLYAKLPREIRDMIYQYLLASEVENKTNYILLPQIVYDQGSQRQKQPCFRSQWIKKLFLQHSQLQEEYAELFYEEGAFCIMYPHLGSLETFLDTDIIFGTDVVPKQHLRDLTLDLMCLDTADLEGNTWVGCIQSRRRALRYRNMLTLPSRLRMLKGLEEGPRCWLKVRYEIKFEQYELGHGASYIFSEFIKTAVEELKQVGIIADLKVLYSAYWMDSYGHEWQDVKHHDDIIQKFLDREWARGFSDANIELCREFIDACEDHRSLFD